jgi:hypothetical protein
MEEYRSKHPMDVLKWVEKVIYSCETVAQLRVADKLIDRCYRKKYITLTEYGTPLYTEWKKVSWLVSIRMERLIDEKAKQNEN